MPSISGARYLHRNGFGDTVSSAGVNGFSGDELKKVYEADHLATFTVAQNQDAILPEDGLRKLRAMENTTGIWTMRCQLVLSRAQLSVRDKQSGEELERFLWSQVEDPTALRSRDASDVFGDVLLFTVREDRSLPSHSSAAEMHVFQAHGVQARAIAEEMKASIQGKFQKHDPQLDSQSSQHYTAATPSPREPPALEPIDYRREGLYSATPYREKYQPSQGTRMLQDALDAQESDAKARGENTDLQVRLLNHCFDDIERFVSRLQASAEAQKELERRRQGRGSRGRRMGEGMLSMRARPPPPGEFMDTLAKFKLAFNLLATLKACIHDPNAPELVHFLFTPLSLVIEASRDPLSKAPGLASKVLSPLLTREAKELLMHCLTSKETDLWMSLGDAWTVCGPDWGEPMRPFYPQFSDGWQPAPHVLELAQPSLFLSRTPQSAPVSPSSTRHRQPPESPYDQRAMSTFYDDPRLRPQRYREQPSPSGSKHSSVPLRRTRASSPTLLRERASFADEHERFAATLFRQGARCFVVRFDRQSNNAKELTVLRGEALEVLESSKNWWRVRNNRGEQGFVPYTILKPW